MSEQKAILVVSFGTAHRETCERTIAAVEREIARAYPLWEVRRAFTSGMILQKLLRRDGVHVDTVTQALQRLVDEGYTQVVIQPTHVINGEEYDDMIADTGAFSGEISLSIGAPLLSGTEDCAALARALGALYPPRPATTHCLMGHGTAHHADFAYAALQYHFQDIGRPDILVGTVEGFPDLAALRRRVAALAPERVVLVPLMVVAGDHAVNDMAGDGQNSWKSVLQADGYAVECVLKGLGEYPPVRKLYLQHLKAAMACL